MVTRSVTRSVTQPVAIPFALAGRSMLRLPYRGASLSLAFDSQQYAMGAIGKRPAAFAFSDLITFTRASGGGRFNASGQYEWLPANTPRIDYDPVTGECLGLLVEEQRTNLFIFSDQLDNAWWYKGGATVTANATVCPDGTTSADKIVEDSATSNHTISRGYATTAGSTYTFSIFLKAAERGFAFVGAYGAGITPPPFVSVNLSNGAISVASGSPANYTSTPIGNGWYRVAITITTVDGTSLTPDFRISRDGVWANRTYLGNGTSGVYIWGAQLEAGSTPSSYIPTTDAQVTRAADVASVNTLSPWYRAAEGTWKVRAGGKAGSPLLTAGSSVIIADSASVKDYTLSYRADPAATSVAIGVGHIESIRYYPRAGA